MYCDDTHCGKTEWIRLSELVLSVLTQLAHSTVNHKSDSVALSQRRKHNKKNYAIYYLFLPKQKPLA